MPIPAGGLRHLPGGDLAEAGIHDLENGIESVSALVVSSFAERLRRSGVDLPALPIPDPEHRLYLLLAREEPDAAHRRYNALVSRLVAFARALECAS